MAGEPNTWIKDLVNKINSAASDSSFKNQKNLKQKNGKDCGFFVLALIEKFVSEECSNLEISDEEAENLRKEKIAELRNNQELVKKALKMSVLRNNPVVFENVEKIFLPSAIIEQIETNLSTSANFFYSGQKKIINFFKEQGLSNENIVDPLHHDKRQIDNALQISSDIDKDPNISLNSIKKSDSEDGSIAYRIKNLDDNLLPDYLKKQEIEEQKNEQERQLEIAYGEAVEFIKKSWQVSDFSSNWDSDFNDHLSSENGQVGDGSDKPWILCFNNTARGQVNNENWFGIKSKKNDYLQLIRIKAFIIIN